MEVVIAAVLNAASYIIIAVVGYLGGRRLGPNQEKTIGTLQDLVDAQEKRIQILESEKKSQDDKLSQLSKELVELKALTIFQAKEIERLTQQASRG